MIIIILLNSLFVFIYSDFFYLIWESKDLFFYCNLLYVTYNDNKAIPV